MNFLLNSERNADRKKKNDTNGNHCIIDLGIKTSNKYFLNASDWIILRKITNDSYLEIWPCHKSILSK